MITCSLWYCICSIIEYLVSSVVVSILYCKFLIDDIYKKGLNDTTSVGLRSMQNISTVQPQDGTNISQNFLDI